MWWTDTRALQILTWLPNGSALDVTVIQFFKALSLGWLLKQRSKLPHFSLLCTMWHIEPIWLSCFWASYPWYAHWRYVIILVCLFFTQSKEGGGICEPCKDIKNKGLEVVAKYKNLFNINANPFEMCVKKVQTLVAKIHINAPKSELAQENLDLLCDLELVLGLPCILPMLEVVHTLIKYAQRQNYFICEFMMTWNE